MFPDERYWSDCGQRGPARNETMLVAEERSRTCGCHDRAIMFKNRSRLWNRHQGQRALLQSDTTIHQAAESGNCDSVLVRCASAHARKSRRAPSLACNCIPARSSGGYFLGGMIIILSGSQTLHQTRGDSLSQSASQLRSRQE